MGFIKNINSNPLFIFAGIALGIIGGLLAIWDMILKPFYKKMNIEYLKHYWEQHWSGLLGLIFIVISLSIFWIRAIDNRRRLASLENFVKLKDEQEIEGELLWAVAFWINAFNKTIEERDEYVMKRFPRNAHKIQEYFERYYINTPAGSYIAPTV